MVLRGGTVGLNVLRANNGLVVLKSARLHVGYILNHVNYHVDNFYMLHGIVEEFMYDCRNSYLKNN